MKKELFFAFGPNNAYFFSTSSSYRQSSFDDPSVPYKHDKVWRKWVVRSPQSNLGWESYMNSRREIRTDYAPAFSKECPKLYEWLKRQGHIPRRVVFGPERITHSPDITVKYSYVAWVPHAGHWYSPYAPQSVQEFCRSTEFTYTHIRLVALGVNDSWIIIWENGEMKWDLKNCYPALDHILETYKEKVDQISHVTLNASQAGDYFIYIDSEKLAMGQVSEAFGGDLEQMLKKEDISCKITTRCNDIDAAPKEMFVAPAPKRVLPAPKRVFPAPHRMVVPTLYRDFNRRLMATSTLRRLRKTFNLISSLLSFGMTIAGVASCNVM
ncbi:hypothetical protein ACMFMG_011627 [Clarireedia jacksonii]